jgi:hypothetical protein
VYMTLPWVSMLKVPCDALLNGQDATTGSIKLTVDPVNDVTTLRNLESNVNEDRLYPHGY